MTAFKTGTPVSSPLIPGMDDQNVWPTHSAKYGQGGFEIVATKADLANITPERRADKAVYVKDYENSEPAMLVWDEVAQDWGDLDITSIINPSIPRGIEVDDGTSDVASVTKLDLKGMKVTGVPNTPGFPAGTAQVTAGINWHMMAPNQQYGSALATEVVIEPPLNTYIDPNATGAEAVRLGIKHGYFELKHKPSFLAYLAETEEVVGKSDTPRGHHDGTLWFGDIIYPAGTYITTDRAAKAYGIEEADELDPNVSGGTDYLVVFRVALKGKAPDDGFVRIYLHDRAFNTYQENKILKDVNGQLMARERFYKAGEELGVLDIIGVVNAKGVQEFTCHAVDTFKSDNINLEDRTEGGTCLMIQAITSDEKTGTGLLQYENDVGHNIEFSSHYLGVDRMNLGYVKSLPQSVMSYTAGTSFVAADGWKMTNPNGLKVGIVDDHVHIQDDGVHICDFNFGKIFSAEETQMLRGHDIDVTVTIIDKDNGYNVALMKWTGAPDVYTPEIFTTRDGGGSPEFQTGWSVAGTLFVSEDAVSGDHTLSKTFVVPDDANNYAIIIYPVSAQQPITLKLKELKADVNPPFIGYAIKAKEEANELHLAYSDKYYKSVQDTQGYASLRYTLNNVAIGQPMPCGIKQKGMADISLDNSVNIVPGSSAKGGEGGLKFGADGEATISTDLLLWNEQNTDTVVNFWWAIVGPGNQLIKIDDSELTATVKAGAKGVSYSMPTFKYQAEQDQVIVLRGKADKQDGAFLESVNDANPLVSVEVQFEELTTVGSYDDPFSDVDLSQFDRVHTGLLTVEKNIVNQSSVVFNIDVPVDMNLSVIQALKIMPNTDVRPVKALDWVYSNTNKTLTVSFGETVALGAVTIGVYA